MLMTGKIEEAVLQPISSALSRSDMEIITRRAIEISVALDARSGQFAAEVRPDTVPAWHIIATLPGCEDVARKRLVERRFGIFDPMYDERYFVHGRRRIQRSRILPGYLFTFVWGIDAHWPLIMGCEGVSHILCAAGSMRAIEVPDQFIEFLQGLEISRLPSVTDASVEAYDQTKKDLPTGKNKRDRAAWKDRREALKEAGTIGTISTKSYLDGITAFDPPERISLFNRAIGLAS